MYMHTHITYLNLNWIYLLLQGPVWFVIPTHMHTWTHTNTVQACWGSLFSADGLWIHDEARHQFSSVSVVAADVLSSFPNITVAAVPILNLTYTLSPALSSLGFWCERCWPVSQHANAKASQKRLRSYRPNFTSWPLDCLFFTELCPSHCIRKEWLAFAEEGELVCCPRCGCSVQTPAHAHVRTHAHTQRHSCINLVLTEFGMHLVSSLPHLPELGDPVCLVEI